jgi:hypothetical protein
MFQNLLLENKKRLLYLMLVIFSFYVVCPYLLYLYKNIFLTFVLNNFPLNQKLGMNYYVQSILSNTNFHTLLILNFFLFFLIFYFLYISLFFKKNSNIKYSNLLSKKTIILIIQLLVCFCIIIVLKDYIRLVNFFFKMGISIFDGDGYRSNTFDIVNGYKQTHFVVGGIFSFYLLKQKKYYIPAIFLILVFVFEILVLSRFYIFLYGITFALLCNRKFLYIILPFILLIIFYRFFDNSNILQLFFNIMWEPISLWCSEIINLKNFIIELKSKNFYSKIFLDNFFVNFIFFDINKSYNPFVNTTFEQFGSYSNFGLIYTLGYPVQTFFLFVTIFLFKKVIDLFSNYDDLFIIVYCFSIFKILRGSSIYGLSFVLKFEILLMLVILLSILLKKIHNLKMLNQSLKKNL